MDRGNASVSARWGSHFLQASLLNPQARRPTGSNQVNDSFLTVENFCGFYQDILIKILMVEYEDSTAEKTNIPWREMTREVLESQVYKEMESIQDPSLVYPDCNFFSQFFFLLLFLFLLLLCLETNVIGKFGLNPKVQMRIVKWNIWVCDSIVLVLSSGGPAGKMGNWVPWQVSL